MQGSGKLLFTSFRAALFLREPTSEYRFELSRGEHGGGELKPNSDAGGKYPEPGIFDSGRDKDQA